MGFFIHRLKGGIGCVIIPLTFCTGGALLLKYKLLLFDLDGMLVDTLDGVLESARYSLEFFGIKRSRTQLLPFLGPPLRYSYKTMFGFDEDTATKAIEKYRERYAQVFISHSRPNPGIPEALPLLLKRGYRLGVATSKYEESAKQMLSAFGLDVYFEFITGSNKSETISTKVQVIREALRRFGMESDQKDVLMIGDMKYDDIGAKEAGISSLGVYTGTAKKGEHEEAGATYIANNISEMTDLLLKF